MTEFDFYKQLSQVTLQRLRGFYGNEIGSLVICGPNEIFPVRAKLCFWLIRGRFSIRGMCMVMCMACVW